MIDFYSTIKKFKLFFDKTFKKKIYKEIYYNTSSSYIYFFYI